MASGGADSFRGRGSRPILQFCCLCMAMPPLAAAFMHQLPSSSVKACRDGRGISTVSETHESHRRFDEFCHHVQAEQQESPVKDRGSSTYFRIDGEGRGESLMSSVDELVLSRRKMLSLGALLFLGGFLSAPSSSFGRDLLEVDGSDGLVWSPKGEILERAESAGGRSAPAKNSTYGEWNDGEREKERGLESMFSAVPTAAAQYTSLYLQVLASLHTYHVFF
jgi:hypothetical protein